MYVSTVPDLQQALILLKKLKPTLQEKWGVTELAVFGSVARGEANSDSDIDIMFDYEGSLGWEIVNLGDFLEAQFQCKVDLLSKKGIRSKVWPFIQDDMRYV